jgi:monoterpene epsilon-lactone hydrolase
MNLHVPNAIVRLGARLITGRMLNPRLPWAVQRRRLDRLVGSWLLPRGVSVTRTEIKGVPVEVVTSTQSRQRTSQITVVHFHGGGYCVGSPAEARDWAAHLSVKTGCRLILPEYRLAPEHPYPAAVDDAHTVVGTVLGDASAGTVLVSGDSAGGGLALGTALSVPGAAALAGCILISPWLDLTADWTALPELARRDVVLSPAWLEACAQAYVPRSANRADPMISPVYANLAGLPPLLIQCGTDDLVAPDSEKLADRAEAVGVDVTSTRWPGLWHDFTLQPDVTTSAGRALDQAAAFITRVSA